MLAAASARAVLCAEHARIRELLAEIDEVVQAGGWAVGDHARTLMALVERLQVFDGAIHRPKGELLFSALRERSAEGEGLVQRIMATRDRCDGLLSQVHAKLEAAAAGHAEAADAVEALLEEHRALTLDHLDAEDAFLNSQAAQDLTRDEWAAIVSSISKSMTPTKN